MAKVMDLPKIKTLNPTEDSVMVETAAGEKLQMVKDFAGQIVSCMAESQDALVELHNSLYRGKVLTDFKTYEEIIQDVKNGDFSDIYAGDIIERDTPAITLTKFAETKKKQYVVIGINSLMDYGDTPLTKPHLVMMPLDDLGTGQMNLTNITTGGYEGSYMNKTIMPAVVTALKSAFGAGNLLTTRELITTAVTDTYTSSNWPGGKGASSSWTWGDCQARLLSEVEYYGYVSWGSSGYDTAGVQRQFPGLKYQKVAMRRLYRWLSSVFYSGCFCLVSGGGYAGGSGASAELSVSPRFTIG